MIGSQTTGLGQDVDQVVGLQLRWGVSLWGAILDMGPILQDPEIDRHQAVGTDRWDILEVEECRCFLAFLSDARFSKANSWIAYCILGNLTYIE